jgi:MraZ protein
MEGGSANETTLKPLLGTDEATLDKKGRLLLSKKKRERLGTDFAVAFGDCGCLVAYPKERWQQIYENIMQYESINQGRQQYTRLVLGLADDELNFDSEGRFVIPSKLRELAKLKDDVVIIGCGDRLEIWDAREYEEFNKYPDVYARDRRQAIEVAYAKMVGR